MSKHLPILFPAISLLVIYLPCQALAGRITPEKTELGYNCTASGHHSTAIGDGSTASGYYSTAMGDHSTASGKYSTAIGKNTTAVGEYSTAMGAFTRAYSAFETVIGCNMTEYTPVSTTAWYPTDRLFVIGNGPGTRSDAMVVLKNGNVGIGSSSPKDDLHVADHIRVGEDPNYSTVYGELKHDGGGTGFRINANAGGGGWADMHFQTNGTTKMFLESGGNVGIGTTIGTVLNNMT